MKIRLTGTAAERAATIELVRQLDGIEMVEVSRSYANRGDSRLQRVCVEARLRCGEYGRDEPAEGGRLHTDVSGHRFGGRGRGVRR